MAIDLTFLRDIENGGRQEQPLEIATLLAEFISAAKVSLHIAIYDFRLTDPNLSDPVINALLERAKAGIKVKIAFDHGKPDAQNVDPFLDSGSDPAPKGTKGFLETVFGGTKVEIESIAGSKLMHNKYVIRDVNTPTAAVLMGSANFTDGAWTYQDNNIVQIASPQLCSYYETDFQELWVSGNIKSTGVNDQGTVMVGRSKIEVAFSPGEGQTIERMISNLIGTARTRIKIASMVITSHTILGALDDAIRHKQVKEFTGVYDETQMKAIVKKWKNSPKSDGIATTFEEIATHLAGKESTPYTPTGKHNFMHDKVVVCDDAVLTGSFNFSRSATQNAENILVIHDKGLADRYSDYIDLLVKQYTHTSQ
jgi:phosphatidylserine/phosphatidylglycerophosphate/cardiolipin synthase-like enzyme